MPEKLPENSDTRCISLVAALKAGRHALGWSQGDLARSSGVSRVTIARMEAGMLKPRPATFDALLQALEASGVRMTMGEPADGFSMVVEGWALKKAKTESSPLEKAVLETLEEMTVDLRSAGTPRVDKQAALRKLREAKPDPKQS